MLLFCKQCGKKNIIENNNTNYSCSNCGAHLVKNKDKKILVACNQCSLGQHIDFLPVINWFCRSCSNEHTHPLAIKNVGNGNSFAEPTKKTTINLDISIIDYLDQYLNELNKDREYKIKRGQFIRLLLKKEFGLKC